MKLLTKNKRAYYDYNILDKYIAGVQLRGSEVKSIKIGESSINEAYCFIKDQEVFIKNMYVAEHKQGGKSNNHVPVRDRKLLLKKKEITQLNDKVKQKGLTLIPLSVLLSPTGFVKIEVGLAKGKNNPDKRQSIKEKDLKRDMERNQ